MKMKHFYCLVIITFLSVSTGHAYVVPMDSQLLVKSDGNNVELYKDSGNGSSWLQMVLVFGHDSSNSQSKLIVDNKPCNSSDKLSTKSAELATTSTEAPIVCKEGFVQLASKKCYLFSTKMETWQDALKSCQAIGTTLAYPLNESENTVLVNYIKKNFEGSDSWYLGASQDVQEGQWFWAHSKSPIGYADWASGQPDNYGNNEDCLNIYKPLGWKWNDITCNIPYNYVCQQ